MKNIQNRFFCTFTNVRSFYVEEKYMKIALKEAKKAYNKDEIPVGAVIIKNGEVVAKAYNLKETKQDTTNHAEILAIKKSK